MKNPVEQLVFLLAASRLPEDEIYEALKAVDRMGATRITKTIFTLRRQMRSLGNEMFEQGEAPGSLSYVQSPLADDIYRLLVEEAGLPTFEAGERLYVSMRSSAKGGTAIPPFRAKEGLRKWVHQISRRISPSELLHHATKIRNEVVHKGVRTDWPLRDRDK